MSSAVVSACRRGRCSLDVSNGSSGWQELTIIDADAYAKNAGWTQPVCDCLIVVTTGRLEVAVVEIKEGRVRQHALDQLQGGADACDRLLQNDRVERCYPVLVHGAGLHTSDFKRLSSKRIKFRGRSYPVLVRRCGARFAEILDEY